MVDTSDYVENPMYRIKRRAPQTRSQDPIYRKDLNPNWTQDDQRLIIYESDAIKGDIQNTLFTVVGEEVFEPTFGSLLPYRLFESVSVRTAHLLESDTIDALTKFMKDDITINHAFTSIQPLDYDDGYQITIVYTDIFKQPVEWRFQLSKDSLGLR